ncbi:hypothetical protein [Vibrio europaeus]|uniref:hypothetical protein n=1 Tax=Vibrio europaeus TaxID=300876 RepID=UPI00233F22E1|nr:hypothetical protein [Vibrio europaeus]MDC5753587.1 hypothetical protein [Vibrio europaeus]MDC5816500.1 hypothetical protein [Vibrio europaeus]
MKYLILIGLLMATTVNASMKEKSSDTVDKTNQALANQEKELIERQQKEIDEFQETVEELFLSVKDEQEK